MRRFCSTELVNATETNPLLRKTLTSIATQRSEAIKLLLEKTLTEKSYKHRVAPEGSHFYHCLASAEYSYN